MWRVRGPGGTDGAEDGDAPQGLGVLGGVRGRLRRWPFPTPASSFRTLKNSVPRNPTPAPVAATARGPQVTCQQVLPQGSGSRP